MKRLIVFIKIVLLCSLQTIAQSEEVLERYKTIMDDVFSGIPSSKVTTGLLIEKAIPYVNLSKYDGSKQSDTISYSLWKKLYKQYCFAHYDYTNVDFSKDFLETEDSKEEIQMGMLLFEYNQVKPEAVPNGQIVMDSVQGKIIDKTSSSTQVLDEKWCFSIAPLVSEITVGTYYFSFPETYFLGNRRNQLQDLSVDFCDGNGFVSVGVGQSRMVVYENPGEKTITARAKVSGTYLYGKGKLVVNSLSGVSDNMLKSVSFSVEPDFGPESFWSNDIESQYAYYGRCQSDGTLRKPYIIVSGFDPMDNNRLIDEGDDKVNLYRVSNKNGYLDQLRNDGYDIIIYRSKNSGESIIPNALNLVDFIQKINSEKTSNNELIIAGASMGGLVVRYALTYMEYHKIDHQTKLFISVDSPQEGANIPLGIQYMVKCLADDLGEYISDMVMLYDMKNQMLDSDAAQEMLLYHYKGTRGSEANCSSKRDEFVAELKSIGNFPKQCRSIGLSMGSGNGQQQGFASGDLLIKKNPSFLPFDFTPGVQLAWEFAAYAVPDKSSHLIYEEALTPKTCIQILTLNGFEQKCMQILPTIASRNVSVDNTISIDNAPGSINKIHNLKIVDEKFPKLKPVIKALDILGNIEFDSHPDNFIPTYSSLGLQNVSNNPSIDVKAYLAGRSGIMKVSDNLYVRTNSSNVTLFDVLYVENENLDHIYDKDKVGVFTEEMNSVMLQESSSENIYVENTTMRNGHRKAIEARSNVFIGNSVDDLDYNNGDVIVESGATMSVLANEKISIEPGTKIKKGASFSARIGNDTYCDESNMNYVKSYDMVVDDYDDVTLPGNDMIPLITQYSDPVIVYPNPVKDELYISSNKLNNKVCIYDVKGKKILAKKFDKNIEVEFSKFPQGTYVIQVTQGNGHIETKQIIKQ